MQDDIFWGARPGDDPGAPWHFGLWVPTATEIHLHLDGERIAMTRNDEGWHSVATPARAGQRYGFERDGTVHPDPASRRQDGGPEALSILVDPTGFARHDGGAGRDWQSAVILEAHVGTFTEAGTLDAARARLPGLARMGITVIELMPLAQFEGARGWGYDGVLPHAIHSAYGTPEDFARFVAEAQALGLMVLVDVVYNHFGPSGNVLATLCPEFFDNARHTPWGAAIAFERPAVMQFFTQNVTMWLKEFGVDGLRLDAVHQFGTGDDTTVLRALQDHVTSLDLGRDAVLVAEDERNLAGYVGADRPLRAQWNDDFHHAIHCLLTGERQSYYAPFAVDPFADLVMALRGGQVDQGQDRVDGHPRGEPSGHLPPDSFVNSNQTHDQIGNRALGERLLSLAQPETVRVAHALLLLAPFIPMLFMGEEEGARAPFRFFTDFDGDLAEIVRNGRRSEFPEFADAPEEVPDPNAIKTFAASRPYANPAPDAADWRALTAELLALRAAHVVPLLRSGRHATQAERLSDRTAAVSWRFADGTLDMALTFEGATISLPAGSRTLYATQEGDAALRVGIRETDMTQADRPS